MTSVLRAFAAAVILTAAVGYCWVLLTQDFVGLTTGGRVLLWMNVISVVGALALSSVAARAYRQTSQEVPYRRILFGPPRLDPAESRARWFGRTAIALWILGIAVLASLGYAIASGAFNR